MVHVGPELMKEEGGGVDAYVLSPFFCGVAEGSLALRIVEVRDAGCSTSTDDFTNVKSVVTFIVAGDDCAAQGVASALPEASAA